MSYFLELINEAFYLTRTLGLRSETECFQLKDLHANLKSTYSFFPPKREGYHWDIFENPPTNFEKSASAIVNSNYFSALR